MRELKDRIRQARTGAGLTQPELAEKIGLTKNFVSLIENGQRSPSDRTISDISRVCLVSEEWLRTGEGNQSTAQADTVAEDRERIKQLADGIPPEAVGHVRALLEMLEK